MSGFGRTSAPVAICGVLGLLEALNSYIFDYSGGLYAPAAWGTSAPRPRRPASKTLANQRFADLPRYCAATQPLV